MDSESQLIEDKPTIEEDDVVKDEGEDAQKQEMKVKDT